MSDGRDGVKRWGRNGLRVTHQVALMVKNPKDLHSEASPREAGCRPAREGPVRCFSWPSQRFALVLRKVQIRKALGNEGWPERITQQPGAGPRNAACGDGLAEQVKYRWNQDRDGFLSPSCSQKGDPACPAGPWSLLRVPRLVEVGEKTGSPWRLHNLMHFKKEACC